jgi:hypothetical protein
MEPTCTTCQHVRPTFVWYLYVIIIASGILFAILYPRWRAYRRSFLAAVTPAAPAPSSLATRGRSKEKEKKEKQK